MAASRRAAAVRGEVPHAAVPRGPKSDAHRAALEPGRVHAIVRAIPRGRVATYGQIAHLAGFPRHARHVGRALAKLDAADRVPWHRVVNAAGEISVRGGDGSVRQRRALEREGVRFDERGRIDMRRFQWRPDPDVLSFGTVRAGRKRGPRSQRA